MRLVRFRHGERVSYGVLETGLVLPIDGEPYTGIEETGERIPLEEVRLLSPVEPGKIVAVGLNYTDHARELGMEIPEEPVLFIKAPSTVIGPGGRVIYPGMSNRVDYECELAAVIGRKTRAVPERGALECVLGYTCSLDMTARDLQAADGQWTRAKNFDTFCPLGPWVETEIDPADLEIELRINGEKRQSSRTSRMIFSVQSLVSFISSVMTLWPGDVIMTGTPPGVGEVSPGDRIETTVEGIGTLSCTVVSQEE